MMTWEEFYLWKKKLRKKTDTLPCEYIAYSENTFLNFLKSKVTDKS